MAKKIADRVLASSCKQRSHVELLLPHLENRHILVQRPVPEAREPSHVNASHLEEHREVGHPIN